MLCNKAVVCIAEKRGSGVRKTRTSIHLCRCMLCNYAGVCYAEKRCSGRPEGAYMLCYMGRIICHTGYVLCIEIYTCLCCATRQLYATQTLHCRCREAWLQETRQLSSATYLTSPPPTTDSQPPQIFTFPPSGEIEIYFPPPTTESQPPPKFSLSLPPVR